MRVSSPGIKASDVLPTLGFDTSGSITAKNRYLVPEGRRVKAVYVAASVETDVNPQIDRTGVPNWHDLETEDGTPITGQAGGVFVKWELPISDGARVCFYNDQAVEAATVIYAYEAYP